jgi:hypothetical protein
MLGVCQEEKTITSVCLPLLALSIIFLPAVSAQILSAGEGHLAATSAPQSRLNIPLIYHAMPTRTQHPTLTLTPTPTGTHLPDLVILGYDITYYEDCPWGSPGLISVGAKNNGLSDSGEFSVKINREFAFVEGLQVQVKTNASVEFEAGPVGHIYAIADVYDQVNESDESNNIFSIALTAPPPCTPATTPIP